jgi:glyoxylase-like metal-dependent hydrolase (beta-lactamase superfamily II)
MDNNTYLVADPATGLAVAIDPSFESETVLEELPRRGWSLSAVWLTHAHFDHLAGVRLLAESVSPAPPVGLHPDDLPLWREGGGSKLFGVALDPGPEPSLLFAHGQVLLLGSQSIEVRHAPGHTPGHVLFYSAESGAALCGDVIFYREVGRTDLPGGSHATLIQSIRSQVLTLPPATRLLCGHGPETTVEEEARENPFL